MASSKVVVPASTHAHDPSGKNPTTFVHVLRDELRCINGSRSKRNVSAEARPDNLTGLAFSGGGIRSASFNLGVLQALDDQHTLPRVDYMSSVSGGSYIAGWVQAHLGGNQHGTYRDDVYYNVGAPDFHNLLDENGDNVEQLRTHSRFI